MIGLSVSKIISIASSSLGEPGGTDLIEISEPIFRELAQILECKDGFLAFESALHFFSARSNSLNTGLDEWNRSDGWRMEYAELASGCFFFAEDVFGGQFCIESGSIWHFDPETGDRFALGGSFEEWAKKILDDYEVLTGYPLAHEWQKAIGPIQKGMRLVPKVPFILGGEFSVSNLMSMDAEKGMRMRANLAKQIKELPDGSKVNFRIEP